MCDHIVLDIKSNFHILHRPCIKKAKYILTIHDIVNNLTYPFKVCGEHLQILQQYRDPSKIITNIKRIEE